MNRQTLSGKTPTGPGAGAKLILIALLVAVVAGAVISCIAFNGDRNQGQTGSTPAVPTGEKPLLTEFGDFQCPHCARFGLELLPVMERDLIKPGTVRFEYRHYPFLGNESFAAAEASECARDQGRFREFHDGLLKLTAQRTKLTAQNIAGIADSLELDPDKFGRCMENGEKRALVLADREYGSSLGVRGTPSLFLDGKPVKWRSYHDLREQIRQRAKQP